MKKLTLLSMLLTSISITACNSGGISGLQSHNIVKPNVSTNMMTSQKKLETFTTDKNQKVELPAEYDNLAKHYNISDSYKFSSQVDELIAESSNIYYSWGLYKYDVVGAYILSPDKYRLPVLLLDRVSLNNEKTLQTILGETTVAIKVGDHTIYLSGHNDDSEMVVSDANNVTLDPSMSYEELKRELERQLTKHLKDTSLSGITTGLTNYIVDYLPQNIDQIKNSVSSEIDSPTISIESINLLKTIIPITYRYQNDSVQLAFEAKTSLAHDVVNENVLTSASIPTFNATKYRQNLALMEYLEQVSLEQAIKETDYLRLTPKANYSPNIANIVGGANGHLSEGLLNPKGEIINGITATTSKWTFLSKVDVNRPLFLAPPRMSDIVQTNSYDCVLLAAIASVLATNGGSSYIEGLIKDDKQNGVFVKMYGPKLDTSSIVKLEKDRDWSVFDVNTYEVMPGIAQAFPPFKRYEMTDSSSKLWVHMLERAYKKLYDGTAAPRSPLVGANASYVLQALLGKAAIHSNRIDKSASEFLKEHNGLPAIVSFYSDKAYIEIEGVNSPKKTMHEFAVISPVVTHDGKEGVWLFNPLQGDSKLEIILNSVSFGVMSKFFTSSFFVPLKSLDNIGAEVSSLVTTKDKELLEEMSRTEEISDGGFNLIVPKVT